MADFENDVLIDGKSLYSLRVIDLKTELKKRGIKAVGTKVQLQQQLISYLNEFENENQHEITDVSQSAQQSEDDNSEQIGDISSVTNDEDSEQKAHDLSDQNSSKDIANTSSVSINEANNSIKLTIKLTPNDHSVRQSPSPKKEGRTPPVDIQSSNETPVEKNESIPEKEVVNESLIESVIKETAKEVVEDMNESKVINTENDNLTPALVEKEVPNDSVSDSKHITESSTVTKVNESTNSQLNEDTDEETDSSNHANEVTTETSTLVEDKQIQEKEELIEITNQSTVESSEKEVSVPSETEIKKEEKIQTESTEEKSKPTIIEEEVKQEVKEDPPPLEKEETPKSVSNEMTAETTDLSVKIEEKSVLSVSAKTDAQEKSEAEPKIVKQIIKPLMTDTEKMIDTSAQSSISEPKVEKTKPVRKRRWGSSISTNEAQQVANKGISSDQLKDLIVEYTPQSTFTSVTLGTNSTSTVTSKVSKFDTSITVTTNVARPQSSSNTTETPSKKDIRVIRKQVSVTEDNTVVTEVSKPVVNKVEPRRTVPKVEETTDHQEEGDAKRAVSPAKKVESNILFITNLVRPFTLMQLKEVLNKNGKLIEDKFWIDKIKSKCLATYETVSEAVAVREALHGTQWPASNPRILSIDFSTEEELNTYLNPEPVKKEVINNNNNNSNRYSDNISKEKYDIIIKTDTDKSVLSENNDSVRNRFENRPIREWDRDKLINKDDQNRSRTPVKKRVVSPQRSQEREGIKRRRHDSTKGDRVRVGDQQEEGQTAPSNETESPAKLLDDLFKKTSAIPSIYWLPLTDEQVVARDALRAETDRKRLEERNAREEQFRKRQEAFQGERRGPEGDLPFRNRGQWRGQSPNRRNFNVRRPSPTRRSSPPHRTSPARRFPSRRSPRYSRS